MAKKLPETPSSTRLNIRVAKETAIAVEEALVALKRHDGVYCSLSMFSEIAMKELLKRRDLPEVMRKHHARARRD
jgi:hypothetical protein